MLTAAARSPAVGPSGQKTAQDSTIGADLDEARRRERSLVGIRWLGVALAVLQVSFEPASSRPAGYALAAGLGLANLLIGWVNARAASPRARWVLGSAALAVDIAVMLGYTYLYAYQEHGSTWLILYLAPLEGAWRRGLRGAVVTAAAVSILYLPREVYREAVFGYGFRISSVVFRLGVLWIVALFAGLTARGLARERDEARGLLEELRRADRLKTAFIANVSHELRTPLTILTGFIDLLQLRFGRLDPEEHRQYLDDMARAARRLTNRIEALLDFAALDRSPLALKLGTVRLDTLVHDVADLYIDEAKRLGVGLECQVEEGITIVADESRLKTALCSLLDNAVKFSHSGGLVHARARSTAGEAYLEVADTGIGIPTAEQQHVFDAFVRAEAAEEGVYAGQGLGLTIVQRIVRAHGGWVEVDSQAGRGSTFRIVLPREPQPSESGSSEVRATT